MQKIMKLAMDKRVKAGAMALVVVKVLGIGKSILLLAGMVIGWCAASKMYRDEGC